MGAFLILGCPDLGTRAGLSQRTGRGHSVLIDSTARGNLEIDAQLKLRSSDETTLWVLDRNDDDAGSDRVDPSCTVKVTIARIGTCPRIGMHVPAASGACSLAPPWHQSRVGGSPAAPTIGIRANQALRQGTTCAEASVAQGPGRYRVANEPGAGQPPAAHIMRGDAPCIATRSFHCSRDW